MGCVPTVKDDVVNVATPPAFKATGAPRFVPLSLNCAVPAGVPAPEVTVAVKVTLGPKLEGFNEESSAVAVLAFATTCPPERLPLLFRKFTSPLYSAVIVWVPAFKVEVVNVAAPPAFKATGAPRLAPLSLNCAVPVGVPALEVTVAVKVTLWPKLDGFNEASSAVVVLAFAIVKVCGTLAAALKFALPAWDAVTVQEPAPVI